MKKTVEILISCIMSGLASSHSVSSQSIDAIPFAGYTFTEKMYFLEGGWGRIDNGISYGLAISKRLKQNSYAELFFSREDAKGSYSAKDYSTGIMLSGEDIPVHASYLMAGYGWLIGLGASGKTEAFAGFNLGAAYFRVEENDNKKWMLAPGLKLGIIREIGSRTGVIIQGTYLAPVQRSGQSIYSGTGGTTAESATLSTVNQFGFSVGLAISIKQSGS